jgi:hypothetical protein
MKKRTLKVMANPFSALDVDGNPQGAVELEGIAGQYVGAVLDPEALRRSGRHGFRFLGEEVSVPLTAYYVRRLRDGDLLPADEEAAQFAGRRFVAPATALAEAREHARLAFLATFGHEPPFVAAESRSP